MNKALRDVAANRLWRKDCFLYTLSGAIQPVLQRCFARLLPELPQEIPNIVEPAFQTYIRYGKGSFFQQKSCPADPVLIDISHRSQTHRLFEETAEILFIQIQKSGQITDENFFTVMLMNIGKHGFDSFDTFVAHGFAV